MTPQKAGSQSCDRQIASDRRVFEIAKGWTAPERRGGNAGNASAATDQRDVVTDGGSVDDDRKGILGRQAPTHGVRGPKRADRLIRVVRADEMNRLAAQDQDTVLLHVEVATDRYVRAAEDGDQIPSGEHCEIVLNRHRPCVGETGACDVQI